MPKCGAAGDSDSQMTIYIAQKSSRKTVGLQISKHDNLYKVVSKIMTALSI